eukprot:5349375-Pyramimonas_sp.AAC.1
MVLQREGLLEGRRASKRWGTLLGGPPFALPPDKTRSRLATGPLPRVVFPPRFLGLRPAASTRAPWRPR